MGQLYVMAVAYNVATVFYIMVLTNWKKKIVSVTMRVALKD